MSQHDTTTVSADSNSTIESDVSDVRDRLESLGADDVKSMNDVELVELREAVKQLEDTVESVRKDTVDAEVKDRVEPGDSLHGLKHVESHSKYVKDDVGRVVMRAVSRGIDYTDFVSLDASALADHEADLAEIGRNEYTYLL